MIDGSTALGEPRCVEHGAAREEPREPEFPSPRDPFLRPCLTPPVFEDDGSPWPPEPSGCRAGGRDGAAWLSLVLLLARRRRAARR